jgi:selenocysteine lyase/cysteine desulfurase
MNKRNFLKTSSLLGLGGLVSFSAIGKMVNGVEAIPLNELAKDEEFWERVRGDYRLKREYINLENGYYNILPQPLLQKYIRHIEEVNLQGAYYMRTVQFENKQRVAQKLAALAGCNADELIITRNTTESLDMIISGMDWRKGDEAVMAEQDYGAMLNMFAQVSKRYGMVNKKLSLPTDPQSDEEIVALYANAITKKTKLLMVCHIVNITGQILPVRKICDMAHARGVPVMVDGAHALGHINFKIKDLNCDFYGCSLHKWLSAPLGAGMLYVKKENISKVWPLLAENPLPEDDILKLNHTGTIPVATDLAIEDAIDYYDTIGAEKKEERLRYLQRYWSDKLREIPNVVFYTPTERERSCAIATIGIKGMKPADMAARLLSEHRVYTVAIDMAGVHGCRITPNVFTTTDELDSFVKAISLMAT